MKILLVTPMPPQSQATGAIPLVLHAQLSGLRQKHAVTLVTIAGLEPGEQAAVERLREQGVDVYAIHKNTVAGMDRWKRRWRMGSAWLAGKLPWRTIWFWEPELQVILDDLLARQPYDLVLVEDNAMGIYRYQTDAPVILTEHEVRQPRPFNWRFGFNSQPASWLFGELDWMRWRKYQLEVWRRFDLIQVFTQRDAERIHRLAPDLAGRVCVNPFGVEIPPLPNGNHGDGKSLIFIGNYTHLPNVDAALWLGREIMPALRQRVPGARLSLIGIYPPREVQDLAGEDIQVTGPVEAIEPYLEKASVVVAPVRIGGGMRMKVLHSMSMGKAVVTTPRGIDGLGVNGETPPVKVAQTASEFAEAVEELLEDPHQRESLGEQARQYVSRHFSPQAYTGRIEEIAGRLEKRRGA